MGRWLGLRVLVTMCLVVLSCCVQGRALRAEEVAPGIAPLHPVKQVRAKVLRLLEQNKSAEAIGEGERAIKAAEETFGSQHAETAHRIFLLANIYERQRRYAEAELLLQDAIAIYEKTLELHDSDMVLAYRALTRIYARQDKRKQAKRMQKRADKTGIAGNKALDERWRSFVGGL